MTNMSRIYKCRPICHSKVLPQLKRPESSVMAKAALQRIKSITADLHSRHKIPKRYHGDIERGCVILWGKPKSTVGTDAREIKVVSRERRAQKTYSEVMEENCHMLLPFMLAVSPRACEGFVKMQEMILNFRLFDSISGPRAKTC